MRRPSILFLNRVYPPTPGATGRLLRDLARAMAAEGWQVTIITTGKKGGTERDGGVRIVRTRGPAKPRGMFHYLYILLKMLLIALRQPSPAIVVSMTDPPLLILVGRLLQKWRKIRHIHWCHDVYPDLLPVLDVWVPALVMDAFKEQVRRAMTQADRVIAIGRCMARILTLKGLDPRQVTVVANWPEPELLQPGDDQTPRFSMHLPDTVRPPEYQLQAGPRFRILHTGTVGRAHAPEIILDAAQALASEHPEIEFMFVGEGPRYEMLTRQRIQRHLDNMRFLPPQPLETWRQVMESGDVHIITLKDRAGGLVVPSRLYSALAVGRPVIFVGPAQSEVAKVIHDFGAGTVIPSGRADLLVQAIKKFRMDGEAWFKAHEGALAAAAQFNPKAATDAWIERAWSVVQEDWQQ
ncbi:MAG: glycosyltransferase family 4 protein [Alphaproteobacteria bacterium]|nr:glycosyltransferase family 4 protein [Alphaproteobacteria bacterium]